MKVLDVDPLVGDMIENRIEKDTKCEGLTT